MARDLKFGNLKFKVVDLGSKVEIWEFIEKIHPKLSAHPL